MPGMDLVRAAPPVDNRTFFPGPAHTRTQASMRRGAVIPVFHTPYFYDEVFLK